MHWAYYNEHDKKCAAWLRNLMAAGLIAPGVVDERDIRDVEPDDLLGFTQCHFFAGIGVWSYALRAAGWPDNRPVWSGSCPCQPFSSAGRRAAFDDERHLWPHFGYLIGKRRPPVVFGEQVASSDADPWIDLVCTQMEAMGYGFGAVPFPASGLGAPNIRERIYWLGYLRSVATERAWRAERKRLERLAHTDLNGLQGSAEQKLRGARRRGQGDAPGRSSACVADGLAEPASGGRCKERADGRRQRARDSAQGHAAGPEPSGNPLGLAYAHRAGFRTRGQGRAPMGYGKTPQPDCGPGGMAYASGPGLAQWAWHQDQPEGPAEAGSAGWVAHAHGRHACAEREQCSGQHGQQPADCPACRMAYSCSGGIYAPEPGALDCEAGSFSGPEQQFQRIRIDLGASGLSPPAGVPGPVNGYWRTADWLYCRDGQWRPVRPSSFPLAHGVAGRVGKLRGFGNALNGQSALAFVRIAMEYMPV